MTGRLRVLAVGLLWCLVASTPSVQSQQAQGAVVDGIVVDASQASLPGVTVTLEQAGKPLATRVSDASGRFRFEQLRPGSYRVVAVLAGFRTASHQLTITKSSGRIPVRLTMEIGALTETITVAAGAPLVDTKYATTSASGVTTDAFQRYARTTTTETYARIEPNPFKRTIDDPLSTFAADVDTASYSNVRRFLADGQLPPIDAVRIEELLNYFRFAYPEPTGEHPVSITTEVGGCPWAPAHKLVLVGVRAKAIDQDRIAGRNIVLLIDVSGSMATPDKLPLVKTALRMFVDTLRDDDRLAIVVYAGASGLVLPSTRAVHRDRIHAAIANLEAGGSTNGGQGLTLAYTVAQEQFIAGGINRVILATDGDFNVGVVDLNDLYRLIEEKKRTGVFLSVLGVGTGNLKDETMEMLADKGNGYYAYLDSLQEARRVLVREGGATLETVAKDVKFQVEFNPAAVSAYRLIGYENRLLAHQDFNDDRKDGGELGAGHTVTVLYEIVPRDAPMPTALDNGNGHPPVDALTYQSERRVTGSAAELAMVKVRYQPPAGSRSTLMTRRVRDGGRALHVTFAALVAEFGLLLRDPEAAPAQWVRLLDRARHVDAADRDRQAFVDLVELAASLRQLKR